MTNLSTRLDLMSLLASGRVNRMWEAEKSGWRCYVMGNDRCTYRRGSKLGAAWEHGYHAAARSHAPGAGMI